MMNLPVRTSRRSICQCGIIAVSLMFGAAPHQAHADTIEISTSETLTYIGHTTSPLSGPQGVSSVGFSLGDLPAEFQQKFDVSPESRVLILHPRDRDFFWFKGITEWDTMTLVVSDENGWFDYAQGNGYIRDKLTSGELSGYSVNKLPVDSSKFTIHAYRGRRDRIGKPFTKFVALEKPASKDAARAQKTEFPIVIEDGGYRLKVRRFISGMPNLIGREPVRNLRQDDYLHGKLELANPTQGASTGIVYELEQRVNDSTVSGQLDNLLGDGYNAARGRWVEFATVKDAAGTTWTRDFSGNRGAWSEIAYMETPLNLPANQGPFTFDLYLVEERQDGSFARDSADAVFRNLVIPEKGKSIDEIKTEVEGIPLTIGMVGPMTDVPEEFSFGQFAGPSVYVSSPKPIPGVRLIVQDENGNQEQNGQWSFPTSDKMHYSILIFGGNQEPEDPFHPGTTITLEVKVPGPLHFQFEAIPERPEADE